jgi:tetratricopeptide (TPR) repeat protein
MRKILILVSLLLSSYVTHVWAVEPAELASYKSKWAEIKYQLDENSQEKAYAALAEKIRGLAVSYPDSAEVFAWKGIIVSTYAGAKGGLGALDLVDESRDALERSLTLDPNALEGSAYTSLGVLYYQVPGWPLSFGDDEEAEKLLKKGLTINPNGIDPNYFYAEFLYTQGEYKKAKIYAEKALSAPARVDRPIADAGRKAEIEALLNKIDDEM